jgi:hypothetical protein
MFVLSHMPASLLRDKAVLTNTFSKRKAGFSYGFFGFGAIVGCSTSASEILATPMSSVWDLDLTNSATISFFIAPLTLIGGIIRNRA